MSPQQEQIEEILEEIEEDSAKTKLIRSLYLRDATKGIIDAVQEKIISRKLLVFLTATGLLMYAGLDPDTWGMVAMFYIGGQSAIDAVKAWRHG